MKERTLTGAALLSMYFIWGSTYLAIRVAIESLPPLLMTSARLFLAGAILLAILLVRGRELPNRRQWRNAAVVGGLMLGGGVGGTAFAEQWVTSGLAAVMVGTVPLWATILAGLLEGWPTRIEWLGLLVGFAGVILLNAEENLRANPLGAAVMLAAPISWALGSILSRRLQLAKGPMAFASEMLAGSGVLLALALLRGERLVETPTLPSLAAWLYLSLFGSLVAYSAYMYLLQTVRVTVATSYAYINPMVAVLLGVTLAGETISGQGVVAMFVILSGVVIISYAQRRQRGRSPSQPVKTVEAG